MKRSDLLDRVKRQCLFIALVIVTLPLAGAAIATVLNDADRSVEVPADEYCKDVVKPEIEWIDIEPGTFLRGERPSVPSISGAHKVTITKPYRLSKYAVTFEQYDLFCEATGRVKPDDEGWGRGNRPVINVTWHDAVAFAEWVGARLPTEAEWELAGRVDFEYSTSPFPNENLCLCTSRVNFNPNKSNSNLNYHCEGNEPVFRGKTVPVGSLPPNSLGLYEMLGNVQEWTQDYDDDFSNRDVIDPTGGKPSRFMLMMGFDNKITKGGSWDGSPSFCFPNMRLPASAVWKLNRIGFRLAISVDT